MNRGAVLPYNAAIINGSGNLNLGAAGSGVAPSTALGAVASQFVNKGLFVEEKGRTNFACVLAALTPYLSLICPPRLLDDPTKTAYAISDEQVVGAAIAGLHSRWTNPTAIGHQLTLHRGQVATIGTAMKLSTEGVPGDPRFEGRQAELVAGALVSLSRAMALQRLAAFTAAGIITNDDMNDSLQPYEIIQNTLKTFNKIDRSPRVDTRIRTFSALQEIIADALRKRTEQDAAMSNSRPFFMYPTAIAAAVSGTRAFEAVGDGPLEAAVKAQREIVEFWTTISAGARSLLNNSAETSPGYITAGPLDILPVHCMDMQLEFSGNTRSINPLIRVVSHPVTMLIPNPHHNNNPNNVVVNAWDAYNQSYVTLRFTSLAAGGGGVGTLVDAAVGPNGNKWFALTSPAMTYTSASIVVGYGGRNVAEILIGGMQTTEDYMVDPSKKVTVYADAATVVKQKDRVILIPDVSIVKYMGGGSLEYASQFDYTAIGGPALVAAPVGVKRSMEPITDADAELLMRTKAIGLNSVGDQGRMEDYMNSVIQSQGTAPRWVDGILPDEIGATLSAFDAGSALQPYLSATALLQSTYTGEATRGEKEILVRGVIDKILL